MAKNKMKWLWATLAVATGIGGLVHALQGGFQINLLEIFGSGAQFVQTVAGLASVVFVVYWFAKK